MITAEYARERLAYCALSGTLRWRRRDDVVPQWNTRYAGTNAGTFDGKKYLSVRLDGRRYQAHRLAWLIFHGETPEEVDHVNNDGTDNRIANLRAATRRQNMWNRSVRRDSVHGVKGVTQNGKRFSAKCYVDGRDHYLGTFDTAEEAGAAYRQFAEQAHGQFFCQAASLNDAR